MDRGCAVAAATYGVAKMVDNSYVYFAGYVVLQYIVLYTGWNILGGYTGYVNFGTAAFKGFAEFYSGDARKAFADVQDAALQAQFQKASADASRAMKDLADWVEAQRPTATQDYALGADRFARMLRATEEVDVPLDALYDRGERDMKDNQEALIEACEKWAPGLKVQQCIAKMNADKPADGPVAEARRQIPMLRQFVVAHDLVTIPGTEQALVEESPPYNRQNSAYIDPPGPFDKGIPSVYYISPPDPSWSKAVQDAYVPGRTTCCSLRSMK